MIGDNAPMPQHRLVSAPHLRLGPAVAYLNLCPARRRVRASPVRLIMGGRGIAVVGLYIPGKVSNVPPNTFYTRCLFWPVACTWPYCCQNTGLFRLNG